MDVNCIISDFKQRKLQIDFLEMHLIQNKSNKKAISYKGRGYLRQTDNDVLTFKLYANETQNSDFVASLNRTNKIKSGELFPHDSYYTLTGIASDGAMWKAVDVLPNEKWHQQHANPIIHGKLSSITCERLSPDPKSLAMHFFEKAYLPVRNRSEKFTVADYEFNVESADDSFTVRAKSDAPLPQHFAIRVEEALRFLLAQSVTPQIIVQPNGIVLTSTTLKSPMVRLRPPISRNSAAFHNKSWALFGAYLDFVTRKSECENWHPCTGYLHMAHEASANSLEAWAIGLTVAVEGLASLINIDHTEAEKAKRAVEDKRLEDLQDFIVQQVSSQKCFTDLKERVTGLVGILKSVRPIDRMHWLTKHGGANIAHVEAWKKLRNRGVHPVAKGDADVASPDFQKWIDELHCVTVLLYHIVFHVIGYRGPYTDYVTRNFPEKNYPVGS